MDFMDGLDQAMNKAKDVFDVACKKTGEVVTTQKQKLDVSSLKNKRDKDFCKLGMLYFEKIKENDSFDDESVAQIVSQIIEKNKKIDEITKEILNTQNKRICASCGASIEVNSIYCNVCGTKVTIENEE